MKVKCYKVKREKSPIDPSGISGYIDLQSAGEDYLLLFVGEPLVASELEIAGLGGSLEINPEDVETECGSTYDEVLRCMGITL